MMINDKYKYNYNKIIKLNMNIQKERFRIGTRDGPGRQLCYVTWDEDDYLYVDCSENRKNNAIIWEETSDGRLYTNDGNQQKYLPAKGANDGASKGIPHCSPGPNGGPSKFNGNDNDGENRFIIPVFDEYADGNKNIRWGLEPKVFTRKKDKKRIEGYPLLWIKSSVGSGHNFFKRVTTDRSNVIPNINTITKYKYPWWANNTVFVFLIFMTISLILNVFWILNKTCFDCKLKNNNKGNLYQKVLEEEQDLKV